jgi:hypothetical protein
MQALSAPRIGLPVSSHVLCDDSEDLSKKIVEAAGRGMKKSEAAYMFEVSFSSGKRYARMVRDGKALSPRKAPGARQRIDERARKLLEADSMSALQPNSLKGVSTWRRWLEWG